MNVRISPSTDSLIVFLKCTVFVLHREKVDFKFTTPSIEQIVYYRKHYDLLIVGVRCS